MSNHHRVHHHDARIDIDEDLQGEVRRLIERVDRQVELWARTHPSAPPNPDRPPLILEDFDDESGT
jgi:hypothetical protein